MEEEKNQIPISFDDFMNPQVDSKDTKDLSEKETWEKRFFDERIQWTNRVRQLSEYLKNVMKISELMATIYTERQLAAEYYHYLISLLIKINRTYRKGYADKYEFYSYKSQKRFPNETTKNNQILSELADIVERRESLENHSKFMDTTIKSIDNIIYAIKSRIEIEQIARGK